MQLKIMSTEECKRKKIDPNMLNRRDQMGDCLQCIEFRKMKRNEIVKCVEEFDDVFTAKKLQWMLIMVGARWSEPSSNRTIEEYCIGNIERETFLERKSLEELRFVTRKRVLLQGFTLHSMYLKDYKDVELLITVKKNSKTANSDSIVLL